MRELTTIAALRTRYGWTVETYSDATIQDAIDAVSEVGCEIAGHDWPYQTDTLLSVLGDGTDELDFSGEPMPLASAPTEILGADWSSYEDFIKLFPADGPPYERLRMIGGYFASDSEVEITADWGWPTVPDDVERTTQRLVRRYLEDESFASTYYTGQSSGQGEIKRVKVGSDTMETEFFQSGSATGQTSTEITSGDARADRVYRRYRRAKLYAVE